MSLFVFIDYGFLWGTFTFLCPFLQCLVFLSMYLLSYGLWHFFLILKIDFLPSLSSIFMCFKANSGGVHIPEYINCGVLSFAFWILAKTSPLFLTLLKQQQQQRAVLLFPCLFPELFGDLCSTTVVPKSLNKKVVPELKSTSVIVSEIY